MRKTSDVTITEDGRDQGKTFQIREMSALKAERWAMRALIAVGKSGVDLPEGFASGGMRSLAIVGVQAIMRMDFADAEPLLDEMLDCIAVKPDPKRPEVVRPLMVDEDIEEVSTLLRLRQEVLELHTSFFSKGRTSEPTSPAPSTVPSSSNTQTFPRPSVDFSRTPPTRRQR
ncbi:hypothetical protein ACN6KF_001452 [Labrys sp. La1]|uniref:hypothetical protein n=1 Tax=Labrys sp. La1 TaxID=3404917 RepID=UPI003EBD9DBF